MRVPRPSFAAHPRARWAAPAVAVALIAGGTVVASQAASADSGLAAKSAAQLLADVRAATTHSLSGTVEQTADLGLPALPQVATPGGAGRSGSSGASGASGDLTAQLTGTHTARVWVDGPTRSRVDLLNGSHETDLVRNGADVWAWSSADKSAVHHTVDASTAGRPDATSVPATPQDAADRLLAALTPTTQVTTAGTAKVAGRSVYELVLTPNASSTRIAQVRLAVDAATSVPLRVQVYSTKLANPAFAVQFTQVDFGTPDASRFSFTPPPGSTVTQGDAARKPAGTAPPNGTKPTVVGSGWEQVVVLPKQAAPAPAGNTADTSSLQSVLAAFPKVSGAWGSGRLVDGTLFSAVVADDGRIAVGAVTPEAVYAALAAS